MSEEQLTGVYRNHAGEIISFLTSEGRVISYRKAIAEAEDGVITVANVEEATDSNNALDFALPNVNELPDIY